MKRRSEVKGCTRVLDSGPARTSAHGRSRGGVSMSGPWTAEIGMTYCLSQRLRLHRWQSIGQGSEKRWQLTCWDPVAWGLMVGKEIVQAGILNGKNGNTKAAIAWSSEGSRA